MAKKSTSNRFRWRRHTFEFLTVFVGVTLAFLLNNWNENRKDRHSEIKILTEIRNGLQLDTSDIHLNILGHTMGLSACDYFGQVIRNESVDPSKFETQYVLLFRDFISVQNRSGYESLKSKGLELIQDDSLRLKVISMYDYYFQLLEKLEEDYAENQFYTSHYHEITNILAPYMVFDPKGKLLGIKEPLKLSIADQNSILSYLSRIKYNRNFMMRNYQLVETAAIELIQQIDRVIDDY